MTKPSATDHAHHWVIDEANGPLSAGRCNACGAEKAFKNWIGEPTYVTREERAIAA